MECGSTPNSAPKGKLKVLGFIDGQEDEAAGGGLWRWGFESNGFAEGAGEIDFDRVAQYVREPARLPERQAPLVPLEPEIFDKDACGYGICALVLFCGNSRNQTFMHLDPIF